MSIYSYKLGDAPEKPDVDTEAESAEALEDALNALSTAYLHGTTAYLLKEKDDENAPLVRPPAELVIADRLATGGASNTLCEYAGKEYLYVTASEGQAVVELAESYTSEKLDDIKESASSFVQQDPSGIRELYEEMHGFHSLLADRMSITESSLDVADLRNNISEEYWDEDLARLFRETVANQIPKAFSVQHNMAVMLASQLQAYQQIVETTWQSIYKIIEGGVDAFFELATSSSPEAPISYAQFAGIVGPALKKAYEPLSVAVDVASGTAGVIEKADQSSSISGSSPMALRNSIHEQIEEVTGIANEGFDKMRAELTLLDSELNALPLHEITLPDIDSVF